MDFIKIFHQHWNHKNTRVTLGVLLGAVFAIVILALGSKVSHIDTKNKTRASSSVLSKIQKIKIPPKAAKSVKISTVKQRTYQVKLASESDIDQPVQFQTKNTSMSFTPLDNDALGPLNKHTVVQKDNVTTYENVYNGVNLVYTSTNNKLLEEYEVRSKHSITELLQKIDITNVDYKPMPDGSLEFYSKDTGAFVYAIPKPVMYEKFNTRNRNYNLHYEIIKQNDTSFLAKVIDDSGQKWLSSAAYPVMIDATVVTNHLTTEDYGVSLGNWQIRLDTVGSEDLHASLSPTTGTFDSLTCNGQAVQPTVNGISISVSNFSCSGDALLTYKLNQPGEFSMNVAFGSDLQTLTTTYSSTIKPVFETAYVDPTLVHPGDTMNIYAHITDESGVATVRANMGGIDTISLSKVSGTANDGQWQGRWTVHDTLAKQYITTVSATNNQNATTISHDIEWFDPYSCTGGGDHAGADWVPATDCPGGIAGNHTNIGTLSVNNGQTATVQAYNGTSFGTFQASATTITISSGGILTADGKGYRGGQTTGAAGEGPGGGSSSAAGICDGAGGGYGGLGANTTEGAAGGVPYGSFSTPTDMGSGGGADNQGCGRLGGNGGGAISLTTTGTLTVGGTVTANGAVIERSGGSGGSVYLTAGTLAGSGTITANGGTGAGFGGGGGGGGRVAAYYSTSNTFNGTTTVTAGTGGSGSENGTAILVDSTNNDLYFITSQTLTANTSQGGFTSLSYHNIAVQNSSTVVVKGYYTNNTNGVGIYFNASNNFTLGSGSTLTATGKGYAGGNGTDGAGPGRSLQNNCTPGGAGYGGVGGTANSAGGATYGSLTAPVDLGSGGGYSCSGAGAGAIGGNGGGAIRISGTGTVSIAGTLSADGNGTGRAGGSGGSIYITSGAFTGAGAISAHGGTSGGFSGGNGAGGRVAIYYTSTNTYSGTLSSAVGTGGAGGENGTSFILNSSTRDLIIPSANGRWYSTDLTSWIFHDLTINGGITFQPTSATLLTLKSTGTTSIASGITITAGSSNTTNSNGVGVYFDLSGNVTIPATTNLTADNTGYAGGTSGSINGSGPGGPTGTNCSAGGAGYGGAGGTNGTTGGTTYGSSSTPLDLGSGGAFTCGGAANGGVGGAGGGAIRLTTPGTLTINGNLTSNATTTVRSAGSGGSIYLTVGTLAGTGNIQAKGGAAEQNGGGGGGGRMAIYYTTNSWSGNTLTAANAATGGTSFNGGAANGSNGTVVLTTTNTPTITSLSQYQSDCTTSIAVGGNLEGAPGAFTGCFKSTVSNADSGDTLQFEVEAIDTSTTFNGITTTNSSTSVYSGTPITESLSISTGFILGTTYHWQARAITSKGAKSAWTSFGGNLESDTDFVPNLPAPTNTTATYDSDTQITITWNDNSSTEDGYEVSRSTDGGGYVVLTSTASNVTSFVDNSTNDPSSPPSANHMFTYKVRTFKGANFSNYDTPSTTYTTPAAPSSANATQSKMGTVVVTWTDNSAYEQYFEVQRKIGSGSYVAISTTISPNTTSYTDTTVEENATYSYQVRAIRTSPDSLNSAFSTASDLPISLGAGKGIYLTSSGRLIVQNNVNNQIDVWTSVQNDSTQQTGADLSYTTALPAGGPNLPAGTTLNNLTVVPGESEADGKSEVIYAATNNGVVAIHENALTPADGAVKRYTKDYISELMVGDIRGAWPLDDSTGSGLFDASPKIQTLTNNGSATFTSGVRGKAVSLNGTNQYLSIADNANLSVTGSVTFGAWIKTNSTSTNQIILAKNGSYSIEITSSGTIKATVSGATTATVTTAGTIDTGWHHVVASYSSTSQTLNIFVDGKADNGSTSGSVPSALTDTAGAFNIGADAGSTLFTGSIDEAFVTAESFTASHVQMLYLAGYRALQNHIVSAITGITNGDSYQKLLGNSAGGATINNTEAVGVDSNNQFLYIGTNDSSGNIGGVSVVGVFSDSVVDLYDNINNTLKLDDNGNQFAASDAIAISIAGVPNPSFRGANDVSSYGGTVAILGTDDTSSRFWLENQSYSLNQVLGSSTGFGSNTTSISVPPSLTNAVGSNGEFLYTPAFNVSEQGAVIQNYIGTNTDITALSFNDAVLTSGTLMGLTSTSLTTGKLLNLTANTLTTGNGFSLNSSSNLFTGNLADISLTGTTGVTGNVLNLSSTASGAGNKVLNISATGTGSVNTALYVSASGATSNYAAIFASGNVGIGTSTPTRGLEIYNRNELLNRGNLMFTQETAPTALTATLGSSGSLSGNYLYKVTFVTANGETEGGTASSNVLASTNTIELSSIPTGTSGVVTARKIYRTAANGSSYFLLTTLNDNTTTTYSDNTIDGTLGAAMPVNNTTAGGILVGGSNRIQIDQTGQIGIGNTAPTAQLDVTGTGKFSTGLTLSSGALSLTATSGSLALTGFGTSSITSTTATGNINTFANSSFSVASGATGNLNNLVFTNTSSNTSGTSTVTGLNITGTNNAIGSGGTQEIYGIRVQALAGTSGAGTQNNYGIRIGNQGLASTEASYGLYIDSQTGSTNSYAAVFAGGKVGIGTTAPGYILDVQDATSKINSKNGYLTNGADYAEYMQNEEAIPAHSLVGYDSTTGRVRTYQAGDEFIGIVSTGIGFVGNGNKDVEIDPSYTLVGLVGQLVYDPTQVEVRNGVAFTHDNKQIGTLLSNGKVLLKGSSSQNAQLGITLDQQGNLLSNNTNTEGTIVANKLNSLTTTVTDALNSTITALTTRVDGLDEKYATLSASLIDSQKHQLSEDAQIASMSASLQQALSDIALLRNGQNIATESAVLGTSTLNASDSTTLTHLLVTHDTNLNNLSVMGTFTTGLLSIDGIDSNSVSINSLAVPLKLQSNLSADVDIMAGKVLIDTIGNVKLTSGDLEIQQGKLVGNDQIRGVQQVNAGQSTAHINQTWDRVPTSITVTAGFDSYVWVDSISTNGFTIHIKTPNNANGKIYWSAIW